MVNLDKEQDKIIESLDAVPTLLLHACCAPCATWCLKKLAPHFDVTLFYANDNILPQAEFEKRFGELEKLVALVNDKKCDIEAVKPVKLVKKQYDEQVFHTVACGREDLPEGGQRCFDCYAMRLLKTAEFANEKFDWFATTLSVSPYKNANWLDQIGKAQITTAKWLPCDFKKKGGYNYTIEFCNKYALYRQHYCGCTPRVEENLN